MAHKAGLILGVIDNAQFEELSKLKSSDPDAYERREKALGTTRDQLVQKFGETAVARAEKEFVRVDQLAKEHLEETQHKGVDTLDYDLARVTNRRLFGTRKDGQVYPKGVELPVISHEQVRTLDLRGAVGRQKVYEDIVEQFERIAEKNGLSRNYGHRLLVDLSPGTLQIRYHLTREQINELKDVARDKIYREGGE